MLKIFCLVLQNYRQIISIPMDLSTALSKLKSEQYSVPKDFISDIKLIFRNAKLYNQKGSMVSDCGFA